MDEKRKGAIAII